MLCRREVASVLLNRCGTLIEGERSMQTKAAESKGENPNAAKCIYGPKWCAQGRGGSYGSPGSIGSDVEEANSARGVAEESVSGMLLN